MTQGRAQCPCCKGRKWLPVHLTEDDEQPRAEPCCHCNDGEIEVEVEELLEIEPWRARMVPRW